MSATLCVQGSKLATQGGKPFLLTQEDFEDCCCGSDGICEWQISWYVWEYGSGAWLPLEPPSILAGPSCKPACSEHWDIFTFPGGYIASYTHCVGTCSVDGDCSATPPTIPDPPPDPE